MKKKLEETYLPDKEARKKRLVIGLSGGLNSYVAAYLLKIQKYELLAVTVVGNWENYNADASDVLSCHLNAAQVETIKEFCHQLGIAHYVMKASDEFKEEVVESWVSSRITGTKSNPCWNCHDLRMRLLYQKMKEVEAQGIATGHLAKLFRQESHQSVYVHTSNDEAHDQSSVLSRVPHEILDKLMLPLSDLQQKEISKLAENFGLSVENKKVKMFNCFDSSVVNVEYLKQNVPPRYLKHGEVFDFEKSSVASHEGVVYHAYGENFPLPNQKGNEPLMISKYTFTERKIEVSHSNHFYRNKLFLTNCKIAEETPWLEPIKGVVKLGGEEYVECWVYPKNLSSALIVMDAPHKMLEGDIVTILKKKGKNAKVHLTGKARFVQEDPIPAGNEEGKERVKVDYSTDF